MVGQFSSLVNLDFLSFNPAMYFVQNSKMIVPIRLLSVSGHAQKGHGRFQGSNFPDSHLYDVVSNVKTDESSEDIRRRISNEVDRAKEFLETLVDETFNDGNRLEPLRDGKIFIEGIDNHEPLFDLLELRRKMFSLESKLDKINFLKGACLVGHMDSSYWREQTMNRFQNKNFEDEYMDIGYGKCMPGNIKKLRENKRSIETLATQKTSKEFMTQLITEGSIIDKKDYKMHNSEGYDPNVYDVYVRQNIGKGICDDAALIWVGKNYKKAGYIGGMIVDTIDTLAKISAFPISGGADELVGRTINQKVKDLTGKPLVSDEEITNLIYFASKANTPQVPFSDSVRRFHELRRRNPEIVKNLEDTANRGVHFTPIWAHLRYVEKDIETAGLSLGFEKFDSSTFYKIMNERFMLAEKVGIYHPN